MADEQVLGIRLDADAKGFTSTVRVARKDRIGWAARGGRRIVE